MSSAFADTNLFLRFLTQDPMGQAHAAETTLCRAAAGELKLVTTPSRHRVRKVLGGRRLGLSGTSWLRAVHPAASLIRNALTHTRLKVDQFSPVAPSELRLCRMARLLFGVVVALVVPPAPEGASP